METAIVSIVCIALIVVGGMTMSQSFLSSVDTTAVGLEHIGVRDEAIMKTNILPLDASLISGNVLEVALRNTGQTKLSDFAKWDVIVQYYDGSSNYIVKWLPYTSGALGDNQWRVKGIYLNWQAPTAEAFEPGILNYGEEIVIQAQVNPVVGRKTTNLVVISTPNGVSISNVFYRN